MTNEDAQTFFRHEKRKGKIGLATNVRKNFPWLHRPRKDLRHMWRSFLKEYEHEKDKHIRKYKRDEKKVRRPYRTSCYHSDALSTTISICIQQYPRLSRKERLIFVWFDAITDNYASTKYTNISKLYL